MRDYLYIWHDPESRFIVASGIELKDVAPRMGARGGLLFLTHKFEAINRSPSTRFDYLPATEMKLLLEKDVYSYYSWGDICWVDYSNPSISSLTMQVVAELEYFKREGKPFQDVALHGLENRFLACAHDDGWFLQIFYNSWEDMLELLDDLKPFKKSGVGNKISSGGAYWIEGEQILEEEPTLDIDAVLNRRK